MLTPDMWPMFCEMRGALELCSTMTCDRCRRYPTQAISDYNEEYKIVQEAVQGPAINVEQLLLEMHSGVNALCIAAMGQTIVEEETSETTGENDGEQEENQDEAQQENPDKD